MYEKYVKRVIDFVLSFFILIFCCPIYIIIAVLIKVFDGGQVIYVQERTGKDGKNFKIYKFRTMKNGKITRLGSFFRRTSLDELPQFYNVLKGDMSIVGPRPWIPVYYENFNEFQKQRVSSRPGIIGLAQVNGRNNINVLEKINYDIKYVKNVSLIVDLKILCKSLKIIVSNEENLSPSEYINNEILMLKNK